MEPRPEIPAEESVLQRSWRRWRTRPLSGSVGVDLALLALVVVGVAMILVAAGCGGSSPESSDDGSQASAEAGATGGGSASSADTDQALEFAQCMRENGVPDFPDPTEEGFRLTPESGVQLGSPEFQEAREACQDVAPPGLPGGGGAPDPQAQERALEFARCMRENGVPGFPDPDVSGGGGVLITPGEGGADFDPSSPEFEAAREECSEHLGGAGGGAFAPRGAP